MQDEAIDDAEVAAIQRAFGAGSLVSQVARSDVRSWMNSADLEVLGAVCHLIVDQPAANDKILPPLERADYDEFLRNYPRTLHQGERRRGPEQPRRAFTILGVLSG